MSNHPDIGNSMNSLGEVLLYLNRTKEAEILFRATLIFKKANLSPNHPNIGTIMSNLGGALF